MKTFAAAILFSILSTVAMAAPDATMTTVRTAVTARYNINKPETLKGYVRIQLDGWNGPAYRLADDAVRTDTNQMGTLMFDEKARLVAVSFSRPSVRGVEMMDLESFSVWHLDVVTAVASN